MDKLDPQQFPPELQAALRSMSQRGPVVDMATGETVAEDGKLSGDGALLACRECARAVALGWWGSIARHTSGASDKPVCVLCSYGEAVLTAAEWFKLTAALVQERTRDGQRRTWGDDALAGLGIPIPPR